MQKDTNVDIMEQAQVQAQLDQLRQEFSAQLNQAAGEIRRLEAENARTREELQGGIGAIPRAIEQMGAQLRSTAAPAAGLVLVDNKGIGKPTMMGDDQDKFAAWARKLENYVIGVFGEDFRMVLRDAAEAEEAVTIGGARGAHPGVSDFDSKVH